MKKLLLLPAALGVTAAVFIEELYRYTFRREGSRLLAPLLDKKGHEEAYYIKRDAAAEALRQRPRKRLQLRSARGELLTGYYYPLGGCGKRIAFLIHGYRSEHAETAGLYADFYASRGFDLFCCDHTAHGESEGRQIGFDLFESEDCLRWIDELLRRFGKDTQLVLHGFSMGAATVMKMSDRCPEQVRFLVADCGYADAEAQLKGSLGPLYPLLRTVNRLIAGYDLRDTDVRPNLERSGKPILFVHGREDRTVPFANGPALYALYPGPKDCLFIDGARHVESMYAAPAAYADKLDAMIRQYFSDESGETASCGHAVTAETKTKTNTASV